MYQAVLTALLAAGSSIAVLVGVAALSGASQSARNTVTVNVLQL